MNIGILYGANIDEDSDEARVAAEVYDADQILFVDSVSKETIDNLETGCHSETVLLVTNDDLADIKHLRSLFEGIPRLAFVQSVANLKREYGYMFPIQ